MSFLSEFYNKNIGENFIVTQYQGNDIVAENIITRKIIFYTRTNIKRQAEYLFYKPDHIIKTPENRKNKRIKLF